MPSYDPQRARSRRRAADDEGPAPVDALLGPSPDMQADEPSAPVAAAEVDVVPTGAPTVPTDEAPTARREPLVIDLDQPAPVNVPRHRGRVVLYALAVLSVVLQVLAWRWWRRRKQARGDQH